MEILAMLTKDEIYRLKPQSNHVLIKVDRKQDEIKFTSGVKLYLDTSFETEKHAPATGHIVAVPDKLLYSRNNANSIEWDTDMEAHVGDYAIVYFMAATNAFRKNIAKSLEDENGDHYMFVKYENIYLVKRGDTILPLNGYCIAEPVMDHELKVLHDRYNKMGFEIPLNMRRKFSTKVVKIVYTGNANRQYRRKHLSDDGIEINPGDFVSIQLYADIPIEYDIHKTLDPEKNYVRLQRTHMTALVYDRRLIQ